MRATNIVRTFYADANENESGVIVATPKHGRTRSRRTHFWSDGGAVRTYQIREATVASNANN